MVELFRLYSASCSAFLQQQWTLYCFRIIAISVSRSNRNSYDLKGSTSAIRPRNDLLNSTAVYVVHSTYFNRWNFSYLYQFSNITLLSRQKIKYFLVKIFKAAVKAKPFIEFSSHSHAPALIYFIRDSCPRINHETHATNNHYKLYWLFERRLSYPSLLCIRRII